VSAARAVLLALALAAAAPAAAFVQTCAVPSTGGACIKLKWPTPTITWKLNTCRPSSSPSCQASGTSQPVLDVAKASFQTWQGATRAGETTPCTDLAFTYGGPTGSIQAGADASEHLIVFRQGWCSENPDALNAPCFSTATCGNEFDCFDDQGMLGRSTLALTSVSYLTDGTIIDSDTELVDWDGEAGPVSDNASGIYVTCIGAGTPPQCTSYGQAGCAYFDLQDTLTHELGHFLGLAHPCGSGSGSPEIACTPGVYDDLTMFPFEAPGETKKRTLAADDIEGVCTLYPRGVAPAAVHAPGVLGSTATATATGAGAACLPAKKSGGGCATGPGLAATTLLALLALGVLRRRRQARSGPTAA
jgi:hypothetical protein